MNLAKATELLKLDNEDPGEIEIIDFIAAEKLGYEALDRIDDWRKGRVLNPDLLLPSETE